MKDAVTREFSEGFYTKEYNQCIDLNNFHMTLTNHYLTGVGVAVVTNNPAIALPAALISHYVLDSLPHYGFKDWESRNQKIFKAMLVIDIVVFSLLLRYLVINSVPGWFYLSGFVGYLPDLAWIYRWIITEKFGTIRPQKMNFMNNFHARIQKHERLWGIIPEVVYGAGMFVFISGSIK